MTAEAKGRDFFIVERKQKGAKRAEGAAPRNLIPSSAVSHAMIFPR